MASLIIHNEFAGPMNLQQLKKQLMGKDEREKINALKEIIGRTINGENLSSLMMVIIKYVLNSTNHEIKRLLLLYWEVVDRYDEDGEPKQEMLLVCNALLQDLQYPNEFLRGCTLRFLCKVKEQVILLPLLESIKQNLHDRYSYVRRNAVMAVYSIFKNDPEILPEAPDLIFEFLIKQNDPSCKRNALIALFDIDRERAIQYIDNILDQVESFPDALQLTVIEMLSKIARISPQQGIYIQCIYSLLLSPMTSHSVQYEAARTIISLSNAQKAVKQAAATFIQLLNNEPDQNVKMVVLDHISDLITKYPRIIEKLLLDVLRGLSSPNNDVRKKIMRMTLPIVTTRNIYDVITLLKKELAKTQSSTLEGRDEYRELLVRYIHKCAAKFPSIATEVAFVLLEYIMDDPSEATNNIILFVREVVQNYESSRRDIVMKLLDILKHIQNPDVQGKALWIVGEYTESEDDILYAFEKIKEAIGEKPPFNKMQEEEEEVQEQQPIVSTRPITLADNTYATTTVYTASEVKKTKQHHLFNALTSGKFSVAAKLSNALCKMGLRLMDLNVDQRVLNKYQAESLLYMSSLIIYGESNDVKHKIDSDSYARIVQCINCLTNPDPLARQVFLELSREYLKETLEKNKDNEGQVNEKTITNVDELVSFDMFANENELISFNDFDIQDLFTTAGTTKNQEIIQLTGYSDPIYAEALVSLQEFTILLDVTVINRTRDTLQNLYLELSCLGEMELVDKPQVYSIGPLGEISISTSIKMSSMEQATIIGSIVYDVQSSTHGENIVPLNDIHINIADYIEPASISENGFRKKWATLLWENKVTVNTDKRSLSEYLDHVLEITRLQCVHSRTEIDESSKDFITANLFGKSAFGEEALANVSIEMIDGKVSGFVRVRAKTEGVAVSLGERIARAQSNGIK